MVARMGGEQVIILVTGRDFPDDAPQVRLAPMIEVQEGEDLFARLWADSRPFDLPGWAWGPGRTLLELVRAVEEKMGEP